MFKASDFIAELTQHVPPKHKLLGNPSDCSVLWAVLQQNEGEGQQGWTLVKFGYNPAPAHERAQNKDSNTEMETVSSKASRQSWSRLIQKVYEVDPMVCPKCNHPLKVIAVITDLHVVSKILECLNRNHDSIRKLQKPHDSHFLTHRWKNKYQGGRYTRTFFWKHYGNVTLILFLTE